MCFVKFIFWFFAHSRRAQYFVYLMFTVIFLQYLAVFFVWLVFFFVEIFVPATTIARTTCRRLASSILLFLFSLFGASLARPHVTLVSNELKRSTPTTDLRTKTAAALQTRRSYQRQQRQRRQRQCQLKSSGKPRQKSKSRREQQQQQQQPTSQQQ